MTRVLLFVSLLFIAQLGKATSYTWVGGTSSDWNDPTNWNPATGVPAAADTAVITAAGLSCTLPAGTTTVTRFRMSANTITIGAGNTLSITGTTNISGGVIDGGTLNATGLSFIITGGTHTANFVVSCTDINNIQNTTFQGTVSFTKGLGIVINYASGGNTYNGAATFVMNGALGWTAATAGDVFNSTATFSIGPAATGNIGIGLAGTTTFNGNVYFTNTTANRQIFFGEGGAISLAATKSMNVASGSFTEGGLVLNTVTQVGTALNDIKITLNGDFSISNCTLGGGLDASAHDINTFQDNIITGDVSIYCDTYLSVVENDLKGAAYFRYGYGHFQTNVFNQVSGTTTIIKRLSAIVANDASNGANIFHGVTYLTDSSSWDFGMASNAVLGGDTYNSDVYLNSANGNLRLAQQGTTYFNGNIYFSFSGGVGNTVEVGHTTSGLGTAIMSAGHALYTTGITTNGNLDQGQIRINHFTQLGNTANVLTPTGARISIARSTFGGDLNATTYTFFNTNNVYLSKFRSTTGTTGRQGQIITSTNSYRDSVIINATFITLVRDTFNTATVGATVINIINAFNNFSCYSGGNVFNGVTTISNLGFGNVFFAALQAGSGASYGGDTFNKDVTFIKASGTLNISNTSASFFNGNIYIQTTANGTITFGGNSPYTNTGTSTIAATKAIYTSAATYTAGVVELRYVTQNGTAANVLDVGSTGMAIRDCDFGGPVTYTGGATSWIYIGASTFRGVVGITTSNGSSGWTSNAFSTQLRSSTFQQSFTLAATRLSIVSCNFSTVAGTTSITKTGATDDAINGDNIFNGVTSIVNSASNANGHIRMSNSVAGDTYNNDLTVTVTAGAGIYLSYSNLYTTAYNGNIYVVGQGTGNIDIGANNAGGTSVLANGKGISNPLAYTGGTLRITLLTQAAGAINAAHTLTLTGTANLLINNTVLEGNLTVVGNNTVYFEASTLHRNTSVTCPNLSDIKTSTFNATNTTTGTTLLTRTGATADNLYGGNTFRGPTTVTNNASAAAGILTFANSAGDAFQSDLTLTNSGASRIRVAHIGASTFNNIYVNSTSGTGIYISETPTTGTATIAAGSAINNGAGAFSAGRLDVRNTTQNGSATNTFNTTSTADLYITSSTLGGNWVSNIADVSTLTSSTFQRALTLTTASIVMNSCSTNTVAGTTTIEKNGTAVNTGNGGNYFGGATTITHTGSTAAATLYWGVTNPDVFATDVTFNENTTNSLMRVGSNSAGNTFGGTTTFNVGGSAMIYAAHTSPATCTFNGPTVFNAAGTSYIRVAFSSGTTAAFNGSLSFTNTSTNGIYFGNIGAGGNTTLSDGAGRELLAPSFTAGNLNITNFTQTGTTESQAMTLTGTSILTVGPSATFNASVDFKSPGLYLNGGTYNGTTLLEKTSSGDNLSTGNNTFNAVTTITQSGTNRMVLANTTRDQYNNDVTYAGAGGGTLEPATAGDNIYQGDMICNRALVFNGNASGRCYFQGNRNAQFIKSTNGSSSSTMPRLVMDKTNADDSLKIGFNQTVSNILTLTKGCFNLNSYTLSVTNTAIGAIVRTTGYVLSEKTDNSSKIAWTINTIGGAHVYPFGKDAATYIPFTLNHTDAASIGIVTVSTYATPAANNLPLPVTPHSVLNLLNKYGVDNSDRVVDRFWQIDKSVATGTATVIFTYAQSEADLQSITEANLKAQRYNDGTDKWQDYAVSAASHTADALNNTVTATGITQFSPWVVSSDVPLPVKFVSVEAKEIMSARSNEIKWSTVNEINCDYYQVEKSTDGVNYSEIGKVKAGKSGSGNYSLRDNNPSEGNNYYRVKMVEFGGAAEVSNIVSVISQNIFENGFEVFPNPATVDNLQIRINEDETEEVLVVLYNALGKEVFTKLILHEKGNSASESLDLNHAEPPIPPGVYLVVGTTNNAIYKKKIIIR